MSHTYRDINREKRRKLEQDILRIGASPYTDSRANFYYRRYLSLIRDRGDTKSPLFSFSYLSVKKSRKGRRKRKSTFWYTDKRHKRGHDHD